MSGLLRWLMDIPSDAFRGVDSWTLRFLALFESFWVPMGLAALFAFLTWLTIRSYRREGQAHHPMKMALAGVRVATLAVLLVLALQPAFVLRYKAVLPTEVVVLVDDSLSMRWADRYSDPTERLSLANYVGASPEQLDGASRLTRRELIQRVLAREGGPLARLAREHPVTLMRFGAAGAKTYTDTLASFGQGDRPTGEPLAKLTAGGYETNLGRAVREALDKLEGHRLAAVVLLSDGQDTSAAGRLAAAKDLLRTRGVPLYAIAVGDPVPPKNILLAQLQGPGEVRKGSTAGFTALIANRGYGGTEVSVDLLRAPVGSDAWEKTGVSEKVTLAAAEEAGKLQEVPLRVETPETGEFVYKAVVAPRPDEMILTDNEAKATVRVSDEKVAVLLASGDGNWEFQFLRDYLLRHPEHYKVSLWQQNADTAFNQEASTGMKLSALPMTRDELFKYDVIILHDPRFAAGSMDSGFLGLLEEFVGTHHGGLCYIAGGKFTEATLLGGGPFDPLNKLLPVVLNRETSFAAQVRTRRTSYAVAVTPEGADHPLLQLGSTAEESKKALAALPGVYRTQAVARLKTLASCLMTNTDQGRQGADGQHEPLIAVQYYGKGRVLYHGFESTWRWRVVDDTKAYQHYWANAVDFLAAGRLEKKRILITAGGDTFDAGAEVRVRVEAYNRDFTPLDRPSFAVTIEPYSSDRGESLPPAGKAVLTRTKAGFFEGVYQADRPGNFVIRPEAGPQADWTDEDVAAKRLEVRLPEEEFRRPEANYDVLKDLAGEPSRFLRLQEADQLAARVPAANQVSVHEEILSLWDRTRPRIAIFAALAVLLLTEWTLRKLYNMV